MGKALLSEAEFSRTVVTRAKRERPDIRVKSMGKCLLLVETESGRRRVVSLLSLYESYREAPHTRDEVVAAFLSDQVYREPVEIAGTFAENRTKVLPQVVPYGLLEYCRQDNQELAAVDYVGGLAVAFVVDEDERYAYIHRDLMESWGVGETDLLKAALENLQELGRGVETHFCVGEGERKTVVWETFDGYDASRILLTGDLNAMAARVGGNPVIAIPHRDYMVMFGDTDPEFLLHMEERIREDFEAHNYPISPRLFTLRGGSLVPYSAERRERLVN
jgi:uncharacterized protein YtpQ (UPF0354 family)